jgi:hypothetical protein
MMLQDEVPEQGREYRTPEAVNAAITPKPKLPKAVPVGGASAPSGVTMTGPGTTITSTAANVPSLPVTPTPAPSPSGVTMTGPGTTITSTAPPAASPAPTATPVPTAVPVPTAPMGGPQLTPTDPNNPLTAQTITAGPGVDRFALAKQKFDTFVQGTDPAYQAALRDATRRGAAMGGLGSGQLRTTYGDLANTRANALDVQQRSVFEEALGGSIDDAWRNIGLTERQQGFQNAQQQQAFENEMRRLGFDDSMLNSAFGRALQTYMAGQTGARAPVRRWRVPTPRARRGRMRWRRWPNCSRGRRRSVAAPPARRRCRAGWTRVTFSRGCDPWLTS